MFQILTLYNYNIVLFIAYVKNMIKLNIIFTLLFHLLINCVSNSVVAQLYLISYEPSVSFLLNFTQPVTLPQFQILLNNINLDFSINTQSNFTDTYQLTIITDPDQLQVNVESYSLIFNYPLNVANGQLSLASYVIEPTKASIQVIVAIWPAYLLFGIIYFCALFGIIGLKLIDFIQIFILAQYKFTHTTIIYEFIGNGFFFSRRTEKVVDSNYLLESIAPLLIVFAAFVICVIIKYKLKNTQSIFLLQVRHFFAYNFFLTTWSIFSMPIFYKFCQHVALSNLNLIYLSPNQVFACGIIAYLNLISTLLYFYLMWFTLNPKPFQDDDEVYQQYLKSQNFQQFQKFHLEVNCKSWHRRNFVIIITIRKLSIVAAFFMFSTIADIIVVIQIMIMFYVFTVRPFKQQFYIYSSIIINMLFFFCFLVLVQGNLYFGMSSVLITQISINEYLTAKNIIFIVICLVIMIFSLIQNFRIFSHIIYQIRMFSGNENDIEQIDLTQSIARQRLYTQSSQTSIRKIILKKQKSIIPQLNDLSSASAIFNKNSISKISNQNTASRAKLNLFQIEMQELKSPSIFRKRTNSSKKIKESSTYLDQRQSNYSQSDSRKDSPNDSVNNSLNRYSNNKNDANLNDSPSNSPCSSRQLDTTMPTNTQKWKEKSSLLQQLAKNNVNQLQIQKARQKQKSKYY